MRLDQVGSGNALVDALGRPLRDLRISVTDRCNLRCTYCMPKEIFGKNFVFLQRADVMTFEEVVRVVKIFVQLGVRKVRLSGGEPLLRKGVENLVAQLAVLMTPDGLPLEVVMTTNGTCLAAKAQALKEAGLSRLTVSLDALHDDVFKRMSDSNVSASTVLAGLSAAQAAGFRDLKVNAVIKRHVNEGQILPLVRHFRHTGVTLRFIEFMDVGATNGWRMDDVVPAAEIVERISSVFPLQAISPNYSGEVAKRWQFADGGGEIGVIASVTQAFCHECTRLRLSTDGKLYNCLFSERGTDIRTLLRSRVSDDVLEAKFKEVWRARQDRYSALRHQATLVPMKRIEMSYIGG